MRRELLAITAAASLLLASTGPAQAQAQDGFLAPVKEVVALIWEIVRAPFQRDAVYAVTPPTLAIARGRIDGFDFWDSLRDAGYEIKEFTTGIGLIPDVKMRFELARELTDADRDWLERRIEIDEFKRTGLTAVIQRQILRTLLAASNLDDMRITKLDVTLLPLPAAEFVMEPKEAPMNEEHDLIYRAVQGHTQQVRGMRSGMSALKPKPAAPEID